MAGRCSAISRRGRGRSMFSRMLRIWDTAHNNGVLIYLLLADRDVEIVADRGIDAKVGRAGWEKICTEMELDFKAGNFESGVIRGIGAGFAATGEIFSRTRGGAERTAGCAGGDLRCHLKHRARMLRSAKRCAADPRPTR